MNQRFEDTYDKATDAICGMAKDYRLLEERHRLLVSRCEVMEDAADILRGRFSDTLNQLNLARSKAALQCDRCVLKHPEYHEAKFTLIEPGRLIEHEESDIDLAIGMDGESFNALAFPSQYDKYFDVLMWRWVFNTVRL